MATYKKGFHKRDPEKMFLKVIFGVIIAVIFLIGVVWVYDATSKWQEYDYFTTITEYEGIFDYTNGGDEELDDYVIYFYATGCSHCQDAKTDVLKLGSKINKNEELFFLANTDSMSDEETNYQTFLDELNITQFGTPTIIVIIDGEVDEIYSGTITVIETLQTIADGTYENFNK